MTRNHDVALAKYESVIDALVNSKDMAAHWTRFQSRNDFAAEVLWEDASMRSYSVQQSEERGLRL